MNKKTIRFMSTSLLTLGLATGALLSFSVFKNDEAEVLGQVANVDNYSLYFNNTQNKISDSSGQVIVKTSNNNNITFSYSGISNSSNWQSLFNGGFFTNQQKISGLKNISVSYSSPNTNKLFISYGWDETMYYQEEITSGQVYYFNSQYPSFFRIDNLTGNQVDIVSISINYSCSESANPGEKNGYVSTIDNHKYLINLNSLSIPNINSAYEHALSLKDYQLDDVDEIVINLSSGSLYLENTFSLTGKRFNNTPIKIRGNKSVLYGGHILEKGIWSLFSDGIYRANIGQSTNKFSTLIVNNEAKVLAKTNQVAFSYSYSNRKISIKKSSLDLSSVSGQCELVTLEGWAQNIGVVSSITSSGYFTVTHTLNLDENGDTIFYDRTPSYRPTSTTSITGYLQDNYAFLDEVNEWYYNNEDGYLYYKPLDGTTINTDNFVVTNIETVLDTNGLEDNVTFDNIQFNGSNFVDPLINGFAETQSSWYYDPSDQQDKMISGMVHIDSVNTSFVNCIFKNASNASIYIDTSCSNTLINNNEIYYSGAEGIIVGHPAKATSGNIPENTTIESNTVNTYGRLFHGAPGICAFYADKLTISCNEVLNGAYSGIAVGWGWLSTQTSYGHNQYRILNNRISNVMNNAFHDGGGIYTLGSFPNEMSELINEISGNYIEVNYQLNGGIYLDEGSSSWDIHENIINVTSEGSTYHGVIMMHDPIDVLNGTYNSQFANHITNNYYIGDVDGSENKTQLTYDNSTNTYYSGSTLSNYNNSRNIVFDTPILGNGTHVNDSVYNLSGISDERNYPFENEDRFAKMISGYSNLSLDSVQKTATFDVAAQNGFTITSGYISDLIKKGYYTLSININAISLNSTVACYAVFITSGTLSWQVFYSQTALGGSMVIPLNKFDTEGATCKVQIRDINGLSLDNNLPARVTLSNISLSEFPPLMSNAYDEVSLVSSYNNEIVYQAKNVSYNWIRILFNGMDIATKKEYSRVRISISGNNHNLYVFKTDGQQIDYNNQILAGGGAVTIDLEDSSRSIAIMTSHENYNVPGGQDESGIYGTTENLRISFKFIAPTYEEVLFSKKTVNKYFSGITIHNVSNYAATVSFTNSRMKLANKLIEELKNNNVSSIEFDIQVPSNSNVQSIVTCWFGGPDNTDVTYSDEGTFIKDSNNIIHAVYYASRFNDAYDIELVSRDINGYQGSDINLENAIITNFVFNY